MKNNILVICAQHGNEKLGPLFKEYVKKHYPALFCLLDFMTGNPKALKMGVRFTDTDLNRSYGKASPKSYEERRASVITSYIRRTSPTLVLDMHTTTTTQPNILIVADTSDEVVTRYLRASHITHVLQVEPMNDLTTVSPHFVAYEVPNDALNETLYEQICRDILRFQKGQKGTPSKEVFRMSGKIMKKEVSEDVANTFVNFSYHPLGFYPILTGENSYRYSSSVPYFGFKANEKEIITL